MIENLNESVFASLESLIKDKYQTYRLKSVDNKKTSKRAGTNTSFVKGRGMEFSDVRQYQPGDEVRTVDWRLAARTGKVYTKVFSEEKDRYVWFLIDLRAQMKFGTKQAFKSVIAAHLVGMLAWYFNEQKDKVGGIVLADDDMLVFRPSRIRRRIMSFFNVISENTRQKHYYENLQENISLANACLKVRRVCRNGNVIFVLSDFSDFDEDVKKALASLAKTNEVNLINIYDVLEGRCPSPNVYLVSDGKKHVILDTRQKDIHDTYVHHFFKRLLMLRDFALKYQIKYIPVSSDMNYYDAVAKVVSKKRKHNR